VRRIRYAAAAARIIARLAARRWTQNALSPLPLLAEALLGVQALQAALRPAIQRGTLSAVGRRLASTYLVLPVAHGVVVAVDLVRLVGRGQLRKVGRPDRRRRACVVCGVAVPSSSSSTHAFSSEYRLRPRQSALQRWRGLAEVVGRLDVDTQPLLAVGDHRNGSSVWNVNFSIGRSRVMCREMYLRRTLS
jgi:hypothetical protein